MCKFFRKKMSTFAVMKRFSLNLRGRLVEFGRPAIMAIINATPDSFYAGARNASVMSIERAIADGADMLDIGAYSSRPGAAEVSVEQEWERLRPVLEAAKRLVPDMPVSIDTFRAEIAHRALDCGADIINDISAATMEPDIADVVARAGAPFVAMHMRGTPATMQSLTDYDADGGVVAAVLRFLAERVNYLTERGVHDVIVDPGFGFAKTVEQNYELLRNVGLLTATLQRPLLVGLSRKSMFYKPLGVGPEDVLPQTTAANLLAVQGGASILRVHDPAAARSLRLFQ